MSQIAMFNNLKMDKIVAINPVVNNKNVLVFDLWSFVDGKYEQLYYQVNNLSVCRVNNNNIAFDITSDLIFVKFIHNVEEQLCCLLKEYLNKRNKKGNFNMQSMLSRTKGKTTIVSSLTNEDYNTLIYNNGKKLTDTSILHNKNSKFNAIFELVGLRFDMKEGTIRIDNRLRMVLESKVLPLRNKLTDVTVFIPDDNSEPEQIVNAQNRNIESIDEQSLSEQQTEQRDEQEHEQQEQLDEQENMQNLNEEVLSDSSLDTEKLPNLMFMNRNLNGNTDLVNLMSQLFVVTNSQ